MITTVYVSAAREIFNQAQLSDLLAQCRRKNAKSDISGMLLYADGNFMQALEGEDGVVAALSDKIARDLRHKSMQVLVRAPIKQRLFGGWSMALRCIDDLLPEDRGTCSRLISTPFPDLPPGSDQVALRLLQSFQRSMA